MMNSMWKHVRLGSLGLTIGLALVLGACGDKEEAPPRAPAATPATTPAEPVAATPAAPDADEGESLVIQPSLVDTLSIDELLVRADAAEKEKQLFVPEGESAFEMYLRVVEQEPENVRARNALSDLFPYAVLYVEQRTAAADLGESERVLDLMQRADEKAPALPRLERSVAQLRERVANDAQRAAAAAAAATAAAAAAAAAPVPVQDPTPIAPPVVQPAVPEPVASAPAPAPEPTPTPVAAAPEPAPAPVVAAPTPPPPAPAATPAAPQVISAVRPRYPPQALRRRIEGSVTVGFTIMPDGSVSNVRVISSRPNNTFDREAVNAMERWRYTATGQQVDSSRVFDFKLTE